MISGRKLILIFFILLLCLSLAVNGWLAYLLYQTIRISEAQQINNKVLSFTDMFIEKVLLADKEINFDTRLELETAIRSIDDQQIFNQWQNFTKAEDKEYASEQAKLLLKILVNKIKSNKN